jgi:hypothetical protein
LYLDNSAYECLNLVDRGGILWEDGEGWFDGWWVNLKGFWNWFVYFEMVSWILKQSITNWFSIKACLSFLIWSCQYRSVSQGEIILGLSLWIPGTFLFSRIGFLVPGDNNDELALRNRQQDASHQFNLQFTTIFVLVWSIESFFTMKTTWNFIL